MVTTCRSLFYKHRFFSIRVCNSQTSHILLKKTNQFVKTTSLQGFSHLQLSKTYSILNVQKKRQRCSQWKERNLWQKHIKKTVIRMFVMMWKCARMYFSARAHICTRVRISMPTWESVHTVFDCMCAATPVCHLCVYVLIMWWLTTGRL